MARRSLHAPREGGHRRWAAGARDLSKGRVRSLTSTALPRGADRPPELGWSGLARAGDELLGAPVGLLVRELDGRVLHEAGRGRREHAAPAAVESELRAAHRID